MGKGGEWVKELGGEEENRRVNREGWRGRRVGWAGEGKGRVVMETFLGPETKY